MILGNQCGSVKGEDGAGERIRTPDRLITKQLTGSFCLSRKPARSLRFSGICQLGQQLMYFEAVPLSAID